MWRLLSMEDGRLSERVDKWMDMAGQHTEGEKVCAFSPRGRRKRPHPTPHRSRPYAQGLCVLVLVLTLVRKRTRFSAHHTSR